ncbi:MAG TPA: aminotransferase class I/II-fold pyridoxal phosphate-dependent enzyme, partial [Gammaproteobacteria bacterium]|nr:aminotransferase class I/II-fold pyridoxal phosphate-dependent enzyme [Gammaproteobacteria bacterium]
MIPYGRQHISEKDIQAVIAVLKSDWLTQGPTVPAFESALCTYTGANHAVAVNSATSALHLACLALGLRPGERLWTSPISFVASANCGLYCGAKVDFVDIDPETCNISPVRLEEKLKNAERRGELPSVVVAVHM